MAFLLLAAPLLLCGLSILAALRGERRRRHEAARPRIAPLRRV